MDRLDYYEVKPRGMKEYLSAYGWHFSKGMCEWAVSMMMDRNKKSMTMPEKKTIEDQLNGVEPKGYDAIYVYCMAKADFFGSSIKDEQQLIKFVNDYLGDPDGYGEMPFTRFYADCIARGIPIIWTDVI